MSTATELRRAFDAAFVVSPKTDTDGLEELLAVRVAGDVHVVRLRDVAGLVRAGKIVALPSHAPGLLGVTGVRGDLVPVFSLSSLLGYSAAREDPRWLVLCGPPSGIVALGVAKLEGTMILSRSELRAAEPGVGPHVSEIARTDAGARAVISIQSVLNAMKARAAGGPGQER